MIIPCNCNGSMKYIHFNCLQTWLKSKYILKSKNTQRFHVVYLKSLYCELCKAQLPDIIKIKSKSYNMREFIKPNFQSYIYLETNIIEKKLPENLLFP